MKQNEWPTKIRRLWGRREEELSFFSRDRVSGREDEKSSQDGQW